MQLNIYKDQQTLSRHTADAILETVKNNPTAVLCLATGDSPRLAYQILAEKAIAEEVDFTHCTFIGLDEWVGVPPENEGSCHFYLENLVFKPLHTPALQVHLFNSMSADLKGECTKMDQAIAAAGGIDLMIVGVGMNGHIGFNEPGISPDLYAHVASLAEITQSVGQKYFTEAVAIKQGITLGLKHVLQSKKLLLVANGFKKAEVMQKAIEETINIGMPASIIRTHSHGFAMIDEEAASLLNIQLVPEGIFVSRETDTSPNDN